jgi:hypothetical protein
MQLKDIIKNLITNLFTSGLFVAISLVILQLLSEYNNLVSFFAFASASFFIVNLFQYNLIDTTNKQATLTFLLHTIIGGVIWVSFAVLMYILYLNNFKRNDIILITAITLTIITITYFYLCYTKKFNF